MPAGTAMMPRRQPVSMYLLYLSILPETDTVFGVQIHLSHTYPIAIIRYGFPSPSDVETSGPIYYPRQVLACIDRYLPV
ncbi:hypothetical protein F5B20DRAFT_561249 [Whalleya microplaca]|nr:hypothetical protein F5B20DRAFT_561249 [Whalleya microplaca]